MSKVERITCITHGDNPIGLNNFYVAGDESIFRGIGHIAICKRCIFELVESYYEQYGKNMRLAIYYTCRKIDVGFDDNVLEGSISSSLSTGNKEVTPTRVIQSYMRQVNSLGRINDSQLSFDDGYHINVQGENLDVGCNNADSEKAKGDEYKVSQEVQRRWGGNYTEAEVVDLEEFYNDMHMTHTIVTPQHEKALVLICKLQLKMDNALEGDDMSGFSRMHGEYQKLLTSSGLRPIDKIGGAEASGMRSFSQIFEEIEKGGFIKPAPIEENQDIVDKTIQYILNYTKKLINKQTMSQPPADTPKVDD